MRGLGYRLPFPPRIAKPQPSTGPLVHLLRCATFGLALGLLTRTSVRSASELPASNVVGVVVLSKDATIGGAPLLSGQNITADNQVEVKDGAAEVTTTDGTQLILGPHTQLSLIREGRGTAVRLNQGNLTFAQTRMGKALSIRAGNVSVFAPPSAKARVVMAMTSQSPLIATQEGSVLVDRDGRRVVVPTGEAVRFEPDAAGQAGSTGSTQSGAPARKLRPRAVRAQAPRYGDMSRFARWAEQGWAQFR